jgi:hypothetical protein
MGCSPDTLGSEREQTNTHLGSRSAFAFERDAEVANVSRIGHDSSDLWTKRGDGCKSAGSRISKSRVPSL